MTLSYLIVREILHRRLHGMLVLVAISSAVGCFLGANYLLGQFDRDTESLVAEKQAVLETQMRRMEDEFRKITIQMGFNVLILPEHQDLTNFYAENFAEQTMPASYAHTLADAPDIVSIRHLLPMVQAKIDWPEHKRKILLIGVQGEMAWTHRNNKKNLMELVEPNQIVLGYELHQSLSLQEGDTVTLMGKAFTVSQLHPMRGSIDDITVWINLAQAQEMLNLQGRISAMTALECQCAWANLPKVREEIQDILPGVQVVELSGKALARAETRKKAAENARLLIQREKENRAQLRSRREGLIAVLIPLVISAAALFVGVLAFLNVRERRVEIGILRGMGLRTKQILYVFLGKAMSLGILGAFLGGAVTYGGVTVYAILSQAKPVYGVLWTPSLLLTVLCATPLVSLLASWIPAWIAIQQDPADVLSED